ncbi:hypothetical protein B484DRAFT_405999 [Ochromonadaceae sp. CCMP2298]|nr:hypothetical protein B484DRAFT_405999 [Ochromonadaceae sp. CCMP2298]
MSASWGDRLWEVHSSVDSFVMGVKMRTDTHLTFRLKRLVPLQVYAGQSAPSTVTGATATGTLGEMGTVSGTAVGEDKSRNRDLQDQQEEEEYLAKLSLSQRIGRVKSANELKQLLQQIKEYHLPRQSASRGSEALTEFQANKFMSLALQLEQPQLAVDLFESAFGFKGDENNARDVLQLFKDGEREEVQWADMPPATKPPPFPTATTPFPTAPAPAPASVPAPSAASEEGGREEGRSVGAGGAVGAGAYKDEGEVREHLRANNFVCTTAAYGRLRGTDKAMAVLPWLEGQGCTADAYLMSAMLTS